MRHNEEIIIICQYELDAIPYTDTLADNRSFSGPICIDRPQLKGDLYQ